MDTERKEGIEMNLEKTIKSGIVGSEGKEQNMNRVAKIVREIMGERSIRQFSIDSDVAASYISGILKGKYLPSAETLRKLASPNANPKNGISLEDLMVAAGYQTDYREDFLVADEETELELELPKVSDEHRQARTEMYRTQLMHDKRRRFMEEQTRFEKMGAGIIYKALAEKRINFKPVFEERLGVRGYRPDMQLCIEGNDSREWWVSFKNVSIEEAPRRPWLVKEVLSRVMFADPDPKRKISFAFCSEETYKFFAEYKDHLAYRGDLSIILLDLDKFSAVEETYLSHYYEETINEFTIV